MKGFISSCLSIVPLIKMNKLKKPIHFVFSYDEKLDALE